MPLSEMPPLGFGTWQIEGDAARESVAAGGGRGPERQADAGPGTTAREAADEVDRLLGLPDPPCTAPRRVLATVSGVPRGNRLIPSRSRAISCAAACRIAPNRSS